jgi:hypothetical protein
MWMPDYEENTFCNTGMDPAWSGRGGEVLCQLWCRVVLVMCAARPSTWIVIVVHSSLIIMLLLKLLYLILPVIIFCFIMKNRTPLPPLWPGLGECIAPPPSKSIPVAIYTTRARMVASFGWFVLELYYLYRVYQKKLNRFEIAFNFAKQLLVSCFLYIWLLWVLIM